MKNAIAKVVLAAIMLAAAQAVLYAYVPDSVSQNVPGKMNYQGYLQDPSTSAPYKDGLYTLECRIYDAETGGKCLWGAGYRAYVKNGYFNIMLGDEATQSLSDVSDIVYPAPSDLWKALWSEDTEWSTNATDSTRYLGVTVLQNPNGEDIVDPMEIKPRQQLLTAPFAFRAQRAKYASGAKSDFTVEGSLRVKGSTTFTETINAQNCSVNIGPIRATSSMVNLGNGYMGTEPQYYSNVPDSIYAVGHYLYFYSYYTMNFAPRSGDVDFLIPSDHKMKVRGDGEFVSDTPVNTIGGIGKTTVTGSPVAIKSAASSLEVGAEGIIGQGDVKWAPRSEKPFLVKTRHIVMDDKRIQKVQIATTSDIYSYMVVGWKVISGSADCLKQICIEQTDIGSDLVVEKSHSEGMILEVHILGINKSFCNDLR